MCHRAVRDIRNECRYGLVRTRRGLDVSIWLRHEPT